MQYGDSVVVGKIEMGGLGEKERASKQVRIGSVLVRLLDSEPGSEGDFQSLSERDCFDLGCMGGAGLLICRCYVATRSLKDERMPEQESAFRNVRDGSYLMLDWLFEGHSEKAREESAEHLHHRLVNDGISFERRPVHTGFYRAQYMVVSEAVSESASVSAELDFDQIYGGVGMTLLQAPNDDTRMDLLTALEERILPETLKEAEAALCVVMTPTPLPAGLSAEAERSDSLGRRVLLLSFFPKAPFGSMRDWSEQLVDRLRAEGLGRLEIAAPFIPIPVIPGTDELCQG